MKYPYVTLADDTEVTHSDVRKDGTVLVYIEKPVMGGFYNATCTLPQSKWSDIHGFSDTEMKQWDDFVHNNAHLIMELAASGGFDHATAV